MANLHSVQRKRITVIGAGVIGLSTALKLQEQGKYDVTIVASKLPSDPRSIEYTSHWAGARDVVNVEDDPVQHRFEKETFKIMWEMSQPGSDAEQCFLHIAQTEYYKVDPGTDAADESMPNFRYLREDELIPGTTSGTTFSAITIDVPVYLDYLLTKFTSLGGRVVHGSVQHVNQVIEGGPKIFIPEDATGPPDAVVVCAGIGARFLGGVEDKDVYPIRGQTVIVKAPWVNFGTALYEANSEFVYIIPRRSGEVIVGGTRVANDWYPHPRPETFRNILERGLAFCPELAPSEVRSARQPSVDDVLPQVVGEGCGLRPGRKGGIRLETEWIEGVGGRGKIPVIHNYGHGGGGYQTSWSSAKVVLELVRDALNTVGSQN